MSPADLIRPCLVEADRRKPNLKIVNTTASCFDLLELALALGGPDWHFIGKSSKKGESGHRPSWLAAKFVSCRRPDGQTEQVLIDLLGMDAAWHIPSGRQVKVVVNSAANDDPRPEIHGPAGLGSYDIDPAHYRWHNPPMPQDPKVNPAPMPPPQPAPTPHTQPFGILSKQDAFNGLTAINDFYAATAGLNRPGGMIGGDGRVDLQAIAQWFYQFVIEGVPLTDVITKIRHSDEWRSKHPGETP